MTDTISASLEVSVIRVAPGLACISAGKTSTHGSSMCPEMYQGLREKVGAGETKCPAAGMKCPAWGAASGEFAQHPAVHFPAASNSIVLPESGICTGTLTAFMKVSVRLPGRSLPPMVPTSLACEAITAAGLTSSLIT